MNGNFSHLESRPGKTVYHLKLGRGLKFFSVLLTVLVVSNLIFLNLVTFGLLEQPLKTNKIVPDEVGSPVRSPTKLSPTPSDLLLVSPTPGQRPPEQPVSCPQACLDLWAEPQVNQEAEKVESTIENTVVKEYYLPLGSGSTTSRDWQEITGAEAVIDAANFSGVKSIIWEAVLRIPTGNGLVQAKLYNVTDKHDVWYSEVGSGSSIAYRAESSEIQLSPGRKLYRVMMRSTMGYDAYLDSARIKLLFE